MPKVNPSCRADFLLVTLYSLTSRPCGSGSCLVGQRHFSRYATFLDSGRARRGLPTPPKAGPNVSRPSPETSGRAMCGVGRPCGTLNDENRVHYQAEATPASLLGSRPVASEPVLSFHPRPCLGRASFCAYHHIWPFYFRSSKHTLPERKATFVAWLQRIRCAPIMFPPADQQWSLNRRITG